MGMYTELKLSVELKYDRELFQALCGMIGDLDFQKPDHPFFQLQRSAFFFHMGSVYFDTQPCVSISLGGRLQYEDQATILLETTFNMKNYDGEIQSFLDYIEPFVLSKGNVGHIHFEETDPKEIYASQDGTLHYYGKE